MKALKRVMWIISIIPFIFTAFLIKGLPDTVPIHYDSNWKIDGYGSKYVDFLLPILIIVFTAVFAGVIRYKEKQAENTEDDRIRRDNEANAKSLAISAIVMALFFVALQFAMIYGQFREFSGEAMKNSLNVGKVANIMIAVTLIVMGNFIPRTKKNGLIGIRTTWSMYNDVTWERSNRMGGKVLFITGIILLPISFFTEQFAGIMWMFILLTVAVIIILVYSKKVYDEQKALDEFKR
ncbi:MAG: SdpI family protein [Lachnospiraceae bacterium]|nr:SdpI family protein [Lachnospiraceae bacterium]